MNEAFKFSAEIKSDLLDDLERIIGRIGDGSLADEQVAAALKALAARLPTKPAKNRGRPVGSRTKGDTPAVRRAREYCRLRDEDGLKPAQAARRVATEWDVDEVTVYKDIQRHDARLADEAQQEQDDLLHEFGLECMAKYPGAADPILEAFRDGLERLALAVETLGNPDAAKWVRAYAPDWERAAVIMFGRAILSLPPTLAVPE